MFPLGGLSKTEVRHLADESGLCNAKKSESQDICFIPDGKYTEFIEKYTGKKYPEGDFVTTEGEVLGRHKGIIHYTIGQRQMCIRDRVLRAMNRGYTFGDYYSTVSFLREKIPDISISADIIVGFPGETEAEFEETLSALKLIQFDSLYSFIYSPRKGTRASEMDCQIDDSIKKERFSRLLDLQNQISYEKNLAYEGKIIEVLVEGIDVYKRQLYK